MTKKIKINSSVSLGKPTKDDIEAISTIQDSIVALKNIYGSDITCTTMINTICQVLRKMPKMHFMEMISTIFDAHQSEDNEQ